MFTSKDLKIIVTGCLVHHHKYIFDEFQNNPNIIFIDKKEFSKTDKKENKDVKRIKIENNTNERFYLDNLMILSISSTLFTT